MGVTVAADALAALREAGAEVVDQTTLRLRVAPHLMPAVCSVLHDRPDLGFTYPADLCATDLGDTIVLWYRFWSPGLNCDVTVSVGTPTSAPSVPTVTSIWPGMNWHERECFDLYGVVFDGHPLIADPARMRILLPEDWVGHPFRKDYRPEFSGDPLHGPQATN